MNGTQPFSREIRRLTAGFLIAFGLVVLAAAYWAVTGETSILQRDDNPRRVEAEAAIQRGSIYDRDDVVLAFSAPMNGRQQRQYPIQAAYSALGYASLRYGMGGIEAAYNAQLRGETAPPALLEALTGRLLRTPQVGMDVQITLDAAVQTRIVEAMHGQRGAVVVISIPDGAVLVMASLPTYDPNQIDAQWETLRTAVDNPLFNRVIQGNYQPGGIAYTPLMAAAMLLDIPIDSPLQPATQPYILGDLTLRCAVTLPDIALTLSEAYTFGCPTPLASTAQQMGQSAVEAVLDTFRFGFRADLVTNLLNSSPQPTQIAVPTVTPPIIAQSTFLEAAMGQGNSTLNPVTAAMIAAAIANDGNAPQPYLLHAQRQPHEDESSWEVVFTPRPTLPITTQDTARRLQDIMRSTVTSGAAQNAGRPDIDIGGQVAIAYAGEQTLTWFIGFTTLAGRQGAAVAVVLENTTDVGLAADIGGEALAAAGAALSSGSAASP